MNIKKNIQFYLSLFLRFMRISYLESKSQYRGVRLGVLSIPVSTLIFTAMLALVFRHSSEPKADFFLYVLSGFILWQYVQSSIAGSTNIIQKSLEFAIHNNMGLPGLFSKLLIDRVYEYTINLALLVLAIMLLDPGKLGISLMLFLPFLALVLSTSLAVSYLVNISTIFFPDLSMLIKTGTRFLFFASPIFWVTSQDAGVRYILETFNPVSYFLAMHRQIFGITPIEWLTWIGGVLISLTLCLTGYITYMQTKKIVLNIK